MLDTVCVAVYRHTYRHTDKIYWSGYTKWYNPEWDGFVGIFEVDKAPWNKMIKAAIELAKAESKKGGAE